MEKPLLKPLPDPFELFAQWMDDALNAELIEPNALTLATVSRSGMPSARQVLLKGHGKTGFIFYTNYKSRKANELRHNSNGSAVMWWDKLYRQVRIEGVVEKTDSKMSDRYFASRPRGSQISAFASPQSEVIGSFSELQQKVSEVERQFHGKSVPRPENWGGYRIIANRIEFWQGRKDRLHERLCYRIIDGRWHWEILAP